MNTIAISHEQLEDVACGICGKRDSDRLFVIRGFPIHQCRVCRMRYVSPRLRIQGLLDLYSQQDYFQSDNSMVHGYVDYLADKPNIVATFAKRLQWMQRMTAQVPRRILDIGCAAGFSVEYALEKKWDAYGLEPSPYAAQAARQRLGERVCQGTLDSHPFHPGTFDTVLLWDVIEHLPDPSRALKQVHELLSQGGWLSLITPDCGSLVAKLMGRYWMEYAKPDEHIFFFSRSTIRDALRQAGFEAVHFSTAGKYVGMDFFADRLAAVMPFLKFLKKQSTNGSPSHSLYINPGDKLFVLARKISKT